MNKLYAVFVNKEELDDVVEAIRYSCNVTSKIIVFSSNDCNELLVSYNTQKDTKPYNNSLSIHRKKDSKTMYTINGLNLLIRDLNNGIADSTYQVNWNNYTNCIILANASSLRILKTNIHKVCF